MDLRENKEEETKRKMTVDLEETRRKTICGLARKQRGGNEEEKDDCGLAGNEEEDEMWTCE